MAANNRTSNIWAFLLGAAVGGGIALALTSRQGQETLGRFKGYLEQSGEKLQGFSQKIQGTASRAGIAAAAGESDRPDPT